MIEMYSGFLNRVASANPHTRYVGITSQVWTNPILLQLQ